MKTLGVVLVVAALGLLVWLIKLIRQKNPLDVFAGAFIIFGTIFLMVFAFNIKELSDRYG